MKYPAFKEGPEVEDFHGTKVPDPFKWLEEPDAEDTKDFVNKQNEIFGKHKIIEPPALLKTLKLQIYFEEFRNKHKNALFYNVQWYVYDYLIISVKKNRTK